MSRFRSFRKNILVYFIPLSCLLVCASGAQAEQRRPVPLALPRGAPLPLVEERRVEQLGQAVISPAPADDAGRTPTRTPSAASVQSELVQAGRAPTIVRFTSERAGIDARPIDLDWNQSVELKDHTGQNAEHTRIKFDEIIRQNGAKEGKPLGDVYSIASADLRKAAILASETSEVCRTDSGCVVVYNGNVYHLGIQEQGGKFIAFLKSDSSTPEGRALKAWWPSRRLNGTGPKDDGSAPDTALLLFRTTPRPPAPPPAQPPVRPPTSKPPGEETTGPTPSPVSPGSCVPFYKEGSPDNDGAKKRLDAVVTNGGSPRGMCANEFVESLKNGRIKGERAQVCDVVVGSNTGGKEGHGGDGKTILKIRTSLCPDNQYLWVTAKGGYHSFSGADQPCYFNIAGKATAQSGSISQLSTEFIRNSCRSCEKDANCPQIQKSFFDHDRSYDYYQKQQKGQN